MEQLFIWGHGFYGYKKVKGVPNGIDDLIIRDNLEDYLMSWRMFVPTFPYSSPEGKDKLPNELYLEIKGNLSLKFDFLAEDKHLKIVSEELLHFLQENGVKDGYEIAKIISVINRSGKELETKPYYILRFYEFDNNLLEYPSEGAVYGKGAKGNKIYPNMTPKSNVDKKIFVLDIEISVIYYQTLIFTQEIRDEIIKRKFIGPKIYSTQEYIQAYNG